MRKSLSLFHNKQQSMKSVWCFPSKLSCLDCTVFRPSSLTQVLPTRNGRFRLIRPSEFEIKRKLPSFLFFFSFFFYCLLLLFFFYFSRTESEYIKFKGPKKLIFFLEEIVFFTKVRSQMKAKIKLNQFFA